MTIFPLVSIIIPVYNGSDYLEEAIDSALNQTYKNIEILVINDGSKDEGKTEKIALKYGKKIQYIKKENGGVATALNIGLKRSNGVYISWLSHDDVYYPNKIEKQITIFLQQDIKMLIWSNFDVIDKDSNVKLKFNNAMFKKMSSKYEYIVFTRVHGCTLLIPKSAFEDAGYFDETLITVQDNHMWLRILKEGYELFHVNEALIQSRQHLKQGSVTMKDIAYEEVKDFYKFVAKILKEELINNKKICEHVEEMINA